MKCFFIFSLSILLCSSLFSQSINGILNINPNPSPFLSDWERNSPLIYQLIIQNNTSSTEQIKLRITLRKNDRGEVLRARSEPISLNGSPAQLITNLLSLDYTEEYSDNQLKSNVLRTGRLPEGEYSLCVNIENLSGAILASNICASFTINYPAAPQLISPANEARIDPAISYPVFQWTPVTVPAGYTVNYTIRIVEVLSGQTPSTAISSNRPIYEFPPLSGNTFTYPVEAPPLEAGKTYAWQVQALDQHGVPPTQNDGKSEIFTFTKVSTSGVGSLTIVYPQNNDTIPWNYFPIIFRFDPYSESYNRCRYSFRLSENGRSLYTRDNVVLNWPRGPRRSQEEALGGITITEEQSQHLAINKRQNETPAPPSFNRGRNYSWSADIEIESGGRTEITGTLNGNFSVGMGKPVLREPRNTDTLSRGTVNLSFLTSNPPSRLVPPFPILQSGGGAANFFNGGIRERWVLEVSRRRDMSEAVQVSNGFIGGDLDLNGAIDNPSRASSAIYRNVNVSYNANDTGWYYWRVKWLRNPDDSTSDAYRVSEIYRFYVRGEARRGTTRPTTPASCIASCEATPITNRTAVTTARVGSDLQIGLFTLRVTEIRWAGETAEGRGTIHVPFLRAPIRVNFRNIKVNNEGRIFEGTVKAEYDDQSVVPSSLTSPVRAISSLNESEIRNLYEYVNQETRRITSFFGDNPIGLPIGLDKIVDGRRYTIAIVGLDFKPDKAELNAMVALDFPELHGWIGLGAKEICFHPNGLGGLGQGMLYLPNDVDLVWSSDITVRLKRTQFSDDYRTISDSGTYVRWDCGGFLSLKISGEIRFGRNLLVEDRDDGSSSSETIVASFTTTVRRHNNWIVSLTFNRPFQINGVNGFGFQVEEAWLDFSDVDNPREFRYPGSSSTDNNWKGLYIKRALCKLPSQFSAPRKTFAVNNLIIDPNGFTANFRAENVLTLAEGNLGGWGLSIDNIQFDVYQNTFRSSGFNGSIQPSFTNTALRYDCLLSRSERGEFNYNFRIVPQGSVNAPIWLATLELDPTSRINVNIDRSGISASAVLNGRMSINANLPEGIGRVNFTAMRFEGLTFQTRAPYIYCVRFGTASPQKFIAMENIEYSPDAPPPQERGTSGGIGGFPVSVNNVQLVTRTEGGTPLAGISFTLNLSLMPRESNTFSASTTLSILGRLNLTGQQRWEYHNVELNEVTVGGSVGVVELRGALRFYRQDTTYGTGMKGFVDATFRPTIRARVAAQFGSKDGYNYWFVDAQALFTPGITLAPGLDIYGFGGGAWYHMRREGSLPDAQRLTTADTSGRGGPGRTLSGVTYIPDNRISFGFEATLVFGNTGGGQSYNADVTFNAQFTSSGGVSEMNLIGTVYFFTPVTNRRDVPVRGRARIGYNFERNIFSGTFDVNFNFISVVSGRGSVVLHFSRDTNFVHIGTPASPITLDLVIPGISSPPRAEAYFMVGNYLPAPPDPPSEVRSILGTEMRFPSRDAMMITSGRGFAFGARFSANTGRITFGPFFGRLNIGAGFDMTLQNVEGPTCEGRTSIGINNWYASGQMYALLQATIGLYVDIAFVQGEYKILDIGAAAALQGGLPNPTWLRGVVGGYYNILNGLVQGNCRFEFSVGERCIIPSESPLGRVNILADLSPANGSTDVDPYVNPVAAFNAEINSEFALEQVRDDGSTVTRRFRFLIERFELKRGTTVVPCNLQVSSDRLSAVLIPSDMLNPNTDYNVTIRLKGQELINDGRRERWEDARNSRGQIIYQELSHNFRTGDAPDHIPPHTVAYSYPFFGQRYFLIDECRNGVVVLKQGRPDLFNVSEPGYRQTYFIRFIPVDGGDTVTAPVVYDNGTRTISFQIPSNLRTSTTYAAQIVRKRSAVITMAPLEIRPQSTTESSRSDISTRYDYIGARLRDVIRSQYRTFAPGVEVRQGRIDGRLTSNPNEVLLYVFFFRTSNYRNLSTKLNALSVTSIYRQTGDFGVDNLMVQFNAPEKFDEFDVYGTSYRYGSQTITISPLIRMRDGLNNPWYNTFTGPIMYNSYFRDLQNFVSSLIPSGFYGDIIRGIVNSSNFGYLNRRLSSPVGVPPVNNVVTIRSEVDRPMNESEYLPVSEAGVALISTFSSFSSAVSSAFGVGSSSTSRSSSNYSINIQFGPATVAWYDYDNLNTITRTIDGLSRSYPAIINIREPLRTQMSRFINSRWTSYIVGSYRIELKYIAPTCANPDYLERIPYIYKEFTFGASIIERKSGTSRRGK